MDLGDADLYDLGRPSHGLHIAMLVRVMPFHSCGGMELYAETMRRGLTRFGHTVTTITTPLPGGVQYVEDQWGAIHGVGTGPPGAYSRSWNEASVRTLLALHEHTPFDVIASHSKAAFPYLRERRALTLPQQLPVVIISHGTFAEELRARIAQFRHDPLGLAKCVVRGVPLWSDDARWLRHAQHLTVQSTGEMKVVRRTYPLGSLPLTVVPHGVDIEALAAGRAKRSVTRERLEIGEDVCAIMVVGSLVPRKGHRYLLEAAARAEVRACARHIQVVAVGDGPAHDSLRQQARSLELGKVTFLGTVPHDEVPALLGAADIFVLPSQVEATSLALVEAMGSGLPVIASDVGSVASVVRDGETGILVAPGDVDALARALATLLQNPKRAHALGAAAQQLVRSTHDQQTMLRKHEQVLITAARSGVGAARPVKMPIHQRHGVAEER